MSLKKVNIISREYHCTLGNLNTVPPRFAGQKSLPTKLITRHVISCLRISIPNRLWKMLLLFHLFLFFRCSVSQIFFIQIWFRFSSLKFPKLFGFGSSHTIKIETNHPFPTVHWRIFSVCLLGTKVDYLLMRTQRYHVIPRRHTGSGKAFWVPRHSFGTEQLYKRRKVAWISLRIITTSRKSNDAMRVLDL